MNATRTLSDLELLAALCSEPDNSSLYTELVNRFYKELSAECTKICKRRKLDSHLGKEICHQAFEKLRRYKSFKAEEIKASSAHKGILAYLICIAVNLFRDWHNKEKRAKEPYVGKSYFEKLSESAKPPENVNRLQWMQDLSKKIFGKLNKVERAVVLADIEHKRHQCYLPDEITEELAQKFGVAKSTIRKNRERGFKKIKNAIDEINQQ